MCGSARMSADSPEAEDELIDLNKEPVERKRKKVEKTILDDNGCGRSEDLPKQCRVLRSRTVAISDGGKGEIKMETVNMAGNGANEASGLEEKDEGEMIDPHGNTKIERRRGRPRKEGSKPEAVLLTHSGKRKRGRPRKGESETEKKGKLPKTESKTEGALPTRRKKRKRGRPPKSECAPEVSSSSVPTKLKRGRHPRKQMSCENSVVVYQEAGGKSNGTRKTREKLKRKWKQGIAPKILNGNMRSMTKKDDVRRCSGNLESTNGGPREGLRVSKDASECSFIMSGAESAEGQDLRRRQQKQLLRDSIVAMLKSAGWSVEYRQRFSKDYHDAVYVDREGKTYWSVTLAYKKFKEKIDIGNADEKDMMAFVPIPEETLRMLFRIGGRGKTRKKNSEFPASKSSKEKTKSRFNVGKQRTLLARKPKDEFDSDGYELYDGKRSLLSWMIDLGTVPLNGKVKYMKGGCKNVLLEGNIEKEGIRCYCCNLHHTIRGFESHAGGIPGRPFDNIYLDSEKSLSQCLLDSWKKHVETDGIGFAYVDIDGDDPNDDTCNVCGDGGDLICCDSCPATFHHTCLHINVPTGDWDCVYCSCKFCGAAGRISVGNKKLVDCHMCNEKFHVDCIKEMTAEEGSLSFCGMACSKIFKQSQDLLGVRNELEEGFSYTVLHYGRFNGDLSLDDDITSLEISSKLAVAFTVMDECFQPLIDERSGASVIHNVVYSCGSNIRRLNYDNFFTIILENGDELVSAASIRIHGSPLAEMPFIGTRYVHRRQGMCSRLLNAIEKVLSSLGIEKLVIPAVAELSDTWTKVFGFVPVEESNRLDMRYMNMIAFPGVDMLQKPIISHHPLDQEMNYAAIQPRELTADQKNVPEKFPPDWDVVSDVKMQEDPTRGTSSTGSDHFSCPDENAPHEERGDVQIVVPPNSTPPEFESCNSSKTDWSTGSPEVLRMDNAQCAPVPPDNADAPCSTLASLETVCAIINAVNLDESSNLGNICQDTTCLSLKSSGDCKLEAQQHLVEENNSCPDVISSENVKSGYC